MKTCSGCSETIWGFDIYKCHHCHESVVCGRYNLSAVWLHAHHKPLGHYPPTMCKLGPERTYLEYETRHATPVLLIEDSDVLLIEDSPARHEWFAARLTSITISDNPQDACRHLKERRWKTMFLDFDLARGTSSRDCANLLVKRRELWPSHNLFIHGLGNPDWLQRTLGDEALQTPFGRFEIRRISPSLIERKNPNVEGILGAP
jgi:hypothetical protein